jgi:23S rRNA (cytidine1920-2'-O)/16S rRNA (cytidine1409-2'-O)-methyltransferase
MRLDNHLCANLGVESRNKAKHLIKAGFILVNSRIEKKPSRNISSTDKVEQIASLHFVSRGGCKRETALWHHSISLEGLSCIDIGVSTGGFTDCMIQYGVKQVLSINVGVQQLHPTLRRDPRVLIMEQTDIRSLSPPPFLSVFLAAVLFSITLCIDYISRLMKEKSTALLLIKPHFEVGLLGYKRDYIPIGSIHHRVIKHDRSSIEEKTLIVSGQIPSPISSAKKWNVEELFIVGKR